MKPEIEVEIRQGRNTVAWERLWSWLLDDGPGCGDEDECSDVEMRPQPDEERRQKAP